MVEESGDGRGSGGHGVWVNNESVTNRIVLQHGDIVFLAPAGNASSWMSGPLDAASDEADAGIVYIFEDFCEHQKQRVQSASKLEATTRLEAKGTKVIHVPMDCAQYNTEGLVFTGPVQLGWIKQCLARPHCFVLHVDGKHKLHHGGWVLMTVGTHYLRYDTDMMRRTTACLRALPPWST